jgi:hypothetical protein
LASFTSIEISDADEELLGAAESRLRAAGAPVNTTPGDLLPLNAPDFR